MVQIQNERATIQKYTEEKIQELKGEGYE